MTTTVVITSGKGGVGKTNISVNTALELSRHQHRVCLLDADLGLANVNILLGLYPEKNLDDVIFRETPLEDIIVQTSYGIDVIPGSSGTEGMANLDNEMLSGLIERFSRLNGYDYLLIDSSSGISRGIISFCLAAEELLLLITPEPTSLTDGYGLLKVLSLNGYQGRVKILVNKCKNVPQAKKTFGYFKAVVDKRLGVSVAPGGVILTDSTVEKAVSCQQPAHSLFPKSTFSLCIKALVSNLLGSTAEGRVPAQPGQFWARYAGYLRSDLKLPGYVNKPAKENRKLADTSYPTDGKNSNGPAVAEDSTPGEKKRGHVHDSVEIQTPLALLSYILDAYGKGRLTPEKIRELIGRDCGLTMKVLHLYHPSGITRQTGITRLEEVLDELDNRVLLRLLLSLATCELLLDQSIKKSVALNKRWAHNLRCAMMAKTLAELTAELFPDAAYLAGLLHDVRFISPQSGQVGKGNYSRDDRADVLIHNGLCSLITDAVRYHDDREERIVTAFGMTRLFYVAHLLSIPSESELTQGVHLATKLLGLSTSQVFTAIQLVSRNLAEIASDYGITYNGDTDIERMAQNMLLYRKQAIDHVRLESVLQLPPRPVMEDMVCAVHQAMSQLFGLKRLIFLLKDRRQSYLQAMGYPGCYSEDNIRNIQFSIRSKASLVVRGCCNGKSSLLSIGSLKTLADKQVFSILRSEEILCLPLPFLESDALNGCILCGLEGREAALYETRQKEFEAFAARAATKLHDFLAEDT